MSNFSNNWLDLFDWDSLYLWLCRLSLEIGNDCLLGCLIKGHSSLDYLCAFLDHHCVFIGILEFFDNNWTDLSSAQWWDFFLNGINNLNIFSTCLFHGLNVVGGDNLSIELIIDDLSLSAWNNLWQCGNIDDFHNKSSSRLFLFSNEDNSSVLSNWSWCAHLECHDHFNCIAGGWCWWCWCCKAFVLFNLG